MAPEEGQDVQNVGESVEPESESSELETTAAEEPGYAGLEEKQKSKPSRRERRLEKVLKENAAAFQRLEERFGSMENQNQMLRELVAAIGSRGGGGYGSEETYGTEHVQQHVPSFDTQKLRQEIAELKEWKANLERFQSEQTRLLEEQVEAFTEFAEEYPDLNDPTTPVGREARRIWAERTDLKRLPDGMVFAAELAMARVARGSATDVKKLQRKVQQHETQAKKKEALEGASAGGAGPFDEIEDARSKYLGAPKNIHGYKDPLLNLLNTAAKASRRR